MARCAYSLPPPASYSFVFFFSSIAICKMLFRSNGARVGPARLCSGQCGSAARRAGQRCAGVRVKVRVKVAVMFQPAAVFEIEAMCRRCSREICYSTRGELPSTKDAPLVVWEVG